MRTRRRAIVQVYTIKEDPEGPAVTLNVSNFLRYSVNLNDNTWVRGCDVPERDGQYWILQLESVSENLVGVLCNADQVKVPRGRVYIPVGQPFRLQFHKDYRPDRFVIFTLPQPMKRKTRQESAV